MTSATLFVLVFSICTYLAEVEPNNKLQINCISIRIGQQLAALHKFMENVSLSAYGCGIVINVLPST